MTGFIVHKKGVSFETIETLIDNKIEAFSGELYEAINDVINNINTNLNNLKTLIDENTISIIEIKNEFTTLKTSVNELTDKYDKLTVAQQELLTLVNKNIQDIAKLIKDVEEDKLDLANFKIEANKKLDAITTEIASIKEILKGIPTNYYQNFKPEGVKNFDRWIHSDTLKEYVYHSGVWIADTDVCSIIKPFILDFSTLDGVTYDYSTLEGETHNFNSGYYKHKFN